MIPLALAGMAAAAAVAAYLLRAWPSAAALIVAVGLAAVTSVALSAPLEGALPFGASGFGDDRFVRIVVAAVAGALALLQLLSVLRQPSAPVAVAAGLTVAGTAVALSAADVILGVGVSAAAGLLGVAVAGEAWRGLARQTAVVIGLSLATVLLGGALAADRPSVPGGALLVSGLAALALVARLGLVPLHVVPVRVARSVARSPLHGAVALHAIVLPALLAMAVAGWLRAGPLGGLGLGWALVGLAALGIATLVLALLAILLQEEPASVVTIHAIGDLAVLAIGIGTPVPLSTLLAWIVPMLLVRLATAGWVVAVATGDEEAALRGWARRGPLLLAGLGVAIVAGIGWPGTPHFDARRTILETAVPGTGGAVLVGVSFALAIGYLRPVVTGLRRAEAPPRGGGRAGRLARAVALALLVGLLAMLPIALSLDPTAIGEAVAAWQPYPGR